MRQFLFILITCLFLTAQGVNASNLPALFTNQGFGVNLHAGSFTIKDLDMIQEAGFKIIRTDLTWHEIEKEKGVYNFSNFDQLLSELSKRNLRPLLVLDYGNSLYGCTLNTNTSGCMQGFKNFVQRAVARYKNYNVIWEIWNEPDCGYFWMPQPDYNGYVNLVKEVAPLIKRIDPNSTVIAPAVGKLDPPYTFLEECFKRGLLNYVDAVSAHPYRDPPLESVIQDYANVRNLIRRYSPYRPNIPIIAGEWGEYSGGNWRTKEGQAKYLLREYLINLYQGIPVTIWYKWKNDGINPYNKDSNWGLVSKNNSTPKEALNAFKDMTNLLNNAIFVKRLDCSDSTVFVLAFNVKNSNKKLLIVWVSEGSKVVSFSDGTVVTLTDKPDYIQLDEIPEIISE